MAYVFSAIIVSVLVFSLYKMIRKRILPSNSYTPFDDLTEGKSREDKN